MPNPKRRHSSSRRGNRRAHDHLEKRDLSLCPNCLESKMPHRVCPHCGYYKGKQVIDVAEA